MDPSTVIAGKKRVEDARERAYDPAIRPSLQKASCEEGGCAGVKPAMTIHTTAVNSHGGLDTRASTFFAGSFLQRWTDCRVISAFTRVFDALLPGNDGGWIHTQSAGKTPSPPAPRASSRDSGTS